ncbi:MAG TPA: hypothetical protein VFI54_06415 [Solirubrobacteraceae bacterium]|nr:hypothetical protein [Solirubrobacteraceae bacterium]
MTQRDQTYTPTCECCGDEQEPDCAPFVHTENGDFCPDCYASLQAETLRMVAKLPLLLGLCPQCADEFYLPLKDDNESRRCPTPGCDLELVVYVRSRLPEGYRS